MKFKAFALLTVFALAVALMGTASPVSAGSYGTAFVTSITYMNVGTGPATITLTFYAENSGVPILITRPLLNVNAGSSIFVGGVSEVAAGFKGSAVMSSDQPLAATMVQLAPAGSPVKNRPLSNGFSGGASYVLVPTALKGDFNSVISIQNVDTVGADLAVKFVPVSGSTVPLTVTNLPSGAAKYFDLGTLGTLGSTFNGSVQITAVKTGTTTPGAVVATSLEASVSTNNVYAFEGLASASDKIYMPSAFCNAGAAGNINSAYAIQNTGTAPTDIKVTYSSGKTQTATGILGGAKFSFQGCAAGNPNGFGGSAVVETVPAGGTIVGIAKIFGAGLSTAFVGVNDGAARLNVPYVRYTEAHWTDGTLQRTNIAIQNVGGADLAAGAVTIKYYDKDGNLVGTDHNVNPLVVAGKFSSNARNTGPNGAEFGYYATGTGGSAVVEGPAGSKLAVVARVASFINATTSVGEDYNGIP